MYRYVREVIIHTDDRMTHRLKSHFQTTNIIRFPVFFDIVSMCYILIREVRCGFLKDLIIALFRSQISLVTTSLQEALAKSGSFTYNLYEPARPTLKATVRTVLCLRQNTPSSNLGHLLNLHLKSQVPYHSVVVGHNDKLRFTLCQHHPHLTQSCTNP